ncbi:MAG: amino acid adenylation domain-containing protein [Nostoc sp.]|uniref:amino acid adenylation domain-containing protein n=1 Tax=Nostoc sp. TaxID=1180 RepID=UPI002FFC6DAE
MTNSIVEFIRQLTSLNIELEADGDRLRCHAPEGVLTPTLRQEIAARKKEIMLFLQQAKQVKTAPQLSIQPVPRDGELPLSFAQQRLWFLHELSPDSRSYNMLLILRLEGSLNIVALQQSLSELVRRHEILRTTFPAVDGKPIQVIAPPTEFTLPVYDLQGLSALEQTAQIRQIVESVASKAFDLAVGPLVEFTLLQLSDREHILLLKMHHIIYDGWSLEIFNRELSQLYTAFSQGLPNSLPELPIQYADFAFWQRQWLAGEVLERQLTYWQKQLAGVSGVLELPTDKPRPPVQTFRGGVARFQLDRNLTQRLKQLSQQSDATLFMTLLAAFLVLLSRYSGQSDIVVGSPIANRNSPQLKNLMGFFANTLALRGDLSGNPSFTDFLTQVRQTTLSAYTHQDLPFEMLVEKLQPGRDLSRNPLVQVMFALQDASLSFGDLPGLTIENISLPIDEMVKFDLDVGYWEVAGGLEGVWSYNTDLFDASTISRIAQHFQTLLQAIVANPTARVAELPLLSPPERHQLLVEWNNTQADYRQDKCIHQLFEEQVKRTPDAVAVVFENEQLTYQQLNTRANQLAHHLKSLGVKADLLVGLCVERSLEMVIGLLGILKAGGAYLPLDPDYPTERLSFMLEDAQVSVLLTQQQLVKSLLKHQACVVCLDTDWHTIAQNHHSNLDNTTTPDNLAYVIYTSGSTGKPKGVLVNHSNVTRLFAATDAWYKFNSDDVWTMFHSYAFDFSVWEIWGALLYGGKLIVVPYLVTRSPKSFYNLLCQEKVTVLNQTPSAFRQLIQAEQSITFPPASSLSLRLVIFGGEALEINSLQPWFERHGDQMPQLVNMYGITETTVHVTYRPLSKADLHSTASVIGRPIPDLQVYVLDEHQQPVPIGVPGEMYVGGGGVARGYLNRSELTQQRFISHPFSNNPQARLYKTGDKARYLPNGELEYLGRIDNQVKIRGFRIELGEIEALLASHPAVWESVVIVREDEPGDKRLVAYVVPQVEKSPTVAEVRQFLKDKLPEYMMPSALVLLESLPLTPNGKVDHRALPKPELDSTLRELYVAPRTPTEEILVQIWAQVLKVEQVGIHDNFFELGGHSLLATQLVSRIRNVFKVELPLRELFATATVAQLAQVIGQLQHQDLELSAPPIFKRAENADLPLSYAQQRLWFLDQLNPNSAFYNIPTALRLVGKINQTALQQSLVEIIHRHEALHTNFIAVDGKPTQIIQQQTNWTVSIVDLKDLPLTEQEIVTQQLAKQQAIQPFDLVKGALVRVTLVVLSETEHVLLVCMHHIVSDGWSMGVFIQELAALYNAYSIGQPSPLTPLPIQYADFALWQRQWLQRDVLQSQLSYWQQQLADAPALLSLPTDRPRPAVQTDNGAYQEFALSQKLTGELTQLSQQQGCTLFMTLLAAFDTLLYRYTGQEDILVGSPIANRDRSEIEGLIGFFVNTLVMRTNLAGNPTFSELLTHVREVALSAYAHQHLPFEMLVEALQPERDLSYTPLFQVMFVLQNAPISGIELSGLSVSSFPMKGANSRFDLTLIMQNSPTGLIGVWEYNTDLFDASTIERMTGHFVTLLEGIITTPEQRISQLPLLTQLEQQQLLVEWNDTEVDYPLHKCIHQLFEEQVELTPDAVAVEYENQQLTYKQLNYRANQLAHYLRSLGVGADVLVGLCVERSLEMVIGLLGILKAGGAYVPIDPEYPSDRLSFILEDTQVEVLLTQQRVIDRLPPNQAKLHFGCAQYKVCLDTDAELISQCSTDNLISGVQPNNLVYIIYTSGSTGKPKGIAMSQLALCNHILWHRDNLKISRGAKTLQFASISFDVSFQEIFTTWCSGGTLFLITEELRHDTSNLLSFLQEKAIQRMFLPVVGLQQLAEFAISNELVNTHLREIITSGDQLRITGAIYEWLGKLNDCTLHNQYGPSESHLATSFTLPNSVETWPLLPPIGRPISNTQIYILDKYLQPVPVGVTGEVYIAGVLLAQGYLNRPQLTQEKFIPNPFGKGRGAGSREQGENSARAKRPATANSTQHGLNAPLPLTALLYKTGDLARYLPDGKLESLGRIDNQVKIRGFRIELGEVEAVLGQLDDVRASCAIVREDIPGDKRLVAYIVPQPEQTCTEGLVPSKAEVSRSTLSVSVVRSFLKEKLPDYMVPSAIIILDALPITPNGKLDRRALPAPDLHSQLSDKYVAPRNPIEEILALIWAQVLKVELVGIHDNFFELGGHSLLATQLVSRVRNSLKVELPLRSLFAAPTVAELSQTIQQLQQQDLELSVPPILPRVRDAQLPLSYAQTRLWFLDKLNPNSAFYNIPIALRLVGTLKVAALEQSLYEIIHRHEALRTNFITVDGEPVQIIREQVGSREQGAGSREQGAGSRGQEIGKTFDSLASTSWIVSVVDLKHLYTTEQEIALQQLAQQQAQQPFNLATEALIRATLVVLSETEHALLVCIHHIVFDGWSMGVFVQELAVLYNAYSQGQLPSLKPLPIQYADFAIWQRCWFQGDVLQSQLSYWQQQLKDAPTFLSLPTDRPRPALQTDNGAYQQFELSVELTNRLVQLSQEQGVTLFMTLLAAYNTLLYRYTGTEDILVGTPIANRDRSEIEGLIGFFVNSLVMRSNLAGNPSFSELLGRVREVALGAYAHQNLPFEMLVEALQPERDLSHTPLFQVMFVLQNAPTSQVELTGLSVSPLPIEGASSRFDLTLIMQNNCTSAEASPTTTLSTSTGLIGVWDYNTDLFDASTIERMTGHFVTLLEGIVTNPEERISQMPLLTAVEQQQLLVDWNNTWLDYPEDQCIHQLFEQQVERTPDAVAVVFVDERSEASRRVNQQLTYQQLNCRANSLAHSLRSLGVKPDTLVGICVERSLEMVVGLLGILKTGGAYLPLDPEYPPERLSFMLEDAQVSLLLTQQRLVDKLPPNQAKVVCLDKTWSEIAQYNQDNPNSGVIAFHLANVIYTSGSTGRPKGVMVEHKGLCNLAQAQIQTFGLTSNSRVLQFASLSFDASIWEFIMAFGSGGTLYIGTKDSLLPGKRLIERLRDYAITHITLPPSALAVMPPEELPALQTIIIAGEACPAELVKQWSVGRNFFNAYGPTEATVCATISKCTSEDEKITIGRAIANTQVYILDKNLQPVPVGVPGELHIGGVGLARGYLNRRELTQERFIKNPFGSGRIYKTGDLARYLPDGNIEYLERIDNQVKIRGFRIELAEIETLLEQHSDIQNCCVIAHEQTGGNKRLIGYVVPQKDITPTTEELRQFLADKLPGYMLPTAFVILESLPLTPNGKVDRRALPAPDLQQELSEYVMPNTEAEKIIAEIWQKALKVEKVGIYNNFFELGGHSLLLVKINQQLQEKFGLELSIVEMFNYPNIHSLSQYLSSKIQKVDTSKQNSSRPQSSNESKAFRNQQLQLRQQYLSQRKGRK